jgi:hypothetical protein
MANGSPATQGGVTDWGSDFFGTLNEMPAEPVGLIGQILDVMASLPVFVTRGTGCCAISAYLRALR